MSQENEGDVMLYQYQDYNYLSSLDQPAQAQPVKRIYTHPHFTSEIKDSKLGKKWLDQTDVYFIKESDQTEFGKK